MVPDSSNLILETGAASVRDAGAPRDISVLAGDHRKDPSLSRLRLLALSIAFEDKFAFEFPSEAVDCFRKVGDAALYIQSHEMTPYDPAVDELPTAASSPGIGVLNGWRRDERTRRNTSSAIARP